MAEPMVSFLAEFDCERRCTVEFDLADVNVRFTCNQMTVHAKQAHDAAHKVDPPRKAYRYAHDLIVKAGAL